MNAAESTRVRRVLHRKRAVLRDSLTVVQTTWRTLRRDRFLVRVLWGIAVAGIVGLFLWKLASQSSPPSERARFRPVAIGVRLVAALCVQYVEA